MLDLLITTNDQIGYAAGLFEYYNHFKKKGLNVKVVCIDRGRPRLIDDGSIIYLKKANPLINRINLILKSSQLSTKNIYVKYFSFCFFIALLNKSKSNILDVRTVSIDHSRLKRFLVNRCIQFESLFFKRIQLITILMNEYLKISVNKIFLVSLASNPVVNKNELKPNSNMIYVGAIKGRDLDVLFKDLGQSDIFKSSDTIFNVVGYNDRKLLEDHMKIIREKNLVNKIYLHNYKRKKDISNMFKNSSIGVAYIPQKEFYNVQPSTKIYEYLVNGLTVVSTASDAHRIFNTNPYVILPRNKNFVKSIEDQIINSKIINRDSIFENSKIYYWKNSIRNLENEIQ